MAHPLVGGKVQLVIVGRVGKTEVALLKVRMRSSPAAAACSRTLHVVVAAGMRVGVVEAEARTRLRDAMHRAIASVQAGWRGRLEGGYVARVSEFSLLVEREGRIWRASAEDRSALKLAVDAATAEKEGASLETLAGRGSRIVEELVHMDVDGKRDALGGALAKAIVRLDRRIEAVRGDLTRIATADAAAERARFFVAQSAQSPRGTARLEAVDWSTGQPLRIQMAIDPARTPKEQIDALFKRARRLKEGARIANARLADTIMTRAALAALGEAVAAQDADLPALEARARDAAPRDFRFKSGGMLPALGGGGGRARRPPCRTFLAPSGARILVGRGAAHNDTLTFRVARPHHLWLHAKGHPGAHVVVPLDKGQSCPADLLVQAAHLAAHFSDARDERVVEVQYTSRRYLRKPRGSAPGIVIVDREKVIVLRREDDLLRVLLERELAE